MDIRNEAYSRGLWAAGAITVVAIVLAVMWWRGELGGTAADAPVPAPSATAISPEPAATPAQTGQQ